MGRHKKSEKMSGFKAALVDRNFWNFYKVRALLSEQDGCHFAIFFQRMAFESYNFQGVLKYAPDTPYTHEMLAAIFSESLDFINEAMPVLERYKLIKEYPSHPRHTTVTGIVIIDFEKLFQSAKSSAVRMRRWRLSHKTKSVKSKDTIGKKEKYEKVFKPIQKPISEKRHTPVTPPSHPRHISQKNGRKNPLRNSVKEVVTITEALPFSCPPQRADADNGLPKPTPTKDGGGYGNGKASSQAQEYLAKYPKKGNLASRQAVERWFADRAPSDGDFAAIMSGLAFAMLSPQWRSDGGAFIPAPQNFLQRESWNDYIPPTLPKTPEEIKAERDAKLMDAVNANPARFIAGSELLYEEWKGIIPDDREAELKRRRDAGLITKEDEETFAHQKAMEDQATKDREAKKKAEAKAPAMKSAGDLASQILGGMRQ